MWRSRRERLFAISNGVAVFVAKGKVLADLLPFAVALGKLLIAELSTGSFGTASKLTVAISSGDTKQSFGAVKGAVAVVWFAWFAHFGKACREADKGV